jgi:hypothetical protein
MMPPRPTFREPGRGCCLQGDMVELQGVSPGSVWTEDKVTTRHEERVWLETSVSFGIIYPGWAVTKKRGRY